MDETATQPETPVSEEMVEVSLYLPATLRARLDAIGADEDRSRSSVARRLLEAALQFRGLAA